jgi:tRNA U34 5-carboxymethylaminomethyl modifying enzyme MnmG/GidA
MGKEVQTLNKKEVHASNDEEIADIMIQELEQQTGKEVFTMRIVGEHEKALEAIVVFTDRSVLMGKITVGSAAEVFGESDEAVKGKLSTRIQGNFI